MWLIENNKLYYKNNNMFILGASYSKVNNLTNEINVIPKIKISLNGLFCCVYFINFKYTEIYEYTNYSIKFLFVVQENNIHTFDFIYDIKLNSDIFIINNNKYNYFGILIND